MPDAADNTLLQELSALERSVWQALVEGDIATDTALLCDSFLGVYPDGFATKSDHSGQLADGPTVKHFKLEEFHLRALGTEHALLSYRAEYQRHSKTRPEEMYVTSLWERVNAGWINIFSQDTPAQRQIAT